MPKPPYSISLPDPVRADPRTDSPLRISDPTSYRKRTSHSSCIHLCPFWNRSSNLHHSRLLHRCALPQTLLSGNSVAGFPSTTHASEIVHRGASVRLTLVVGVAVPVVDAVSKGRGAVLGHVLIAAQYMLLGILSTGRVGAGPRRTELDSRLVLICEEGLVPPINTIV